MRTPSCRVVHRSQRRHLTAGKRGADKAWASAWQTAGGFCSGCRPVWRTESRCARCCIQGQLRLCLWAAQLRRCRRQRLLRQLRGPWSQRWWGSRPTRLRGKEALRLGCVSHCDRAARRQHRGNVHESRSSLWQSQLWRTLHFRLFHLADRAWTTRCGFRNLSIVAVVGSRWKHGRVVLTWTLDTAPLIPQRQ